MTFFQFIGMVHRWYNEMMYVLLDGFFIIFHLGMVLFNLFGWMWKPVRRINLILLLLTAASWFVLGIFYGWGYCPCTDWHWRIRQKLGHHDMPASYVKFLIQKLTGINLDARLVDVTTLVFLLIALAISSWLNIRDWKRSKQAN